jgi:hypothetical protein
VRLYEYKQLPEKAGSAIMTWDQAAAAPCRENEIITLPKKHNVELFMLKEGQQFLYVAGNDVFFGGTEESPFLARLKLEAVAPLWQHGEEAFFEGLKPANIVRLERYYRRQAVRQGDIFAMPLQANWKSIGIVMTLIDHTAFPEPAAPRNVTDCNLFGTRHTMSGLALLLTNNLVLFEGTLSAPDHSARTLKGIHLMDQARNMFDAKGVD